MSDIKLRHDFERMLRAGQRREVERCLEEMNLQRIPRADALRIANVARRIQRFDWAVKILNPIVRDPRPVGGEATSLEKIEYAETLRRLGAVAESEDILKQINASEFPQVNLYLAMCNFAQWQYRKAIPHLRAYIASSDISSYQRLVGKVNLASALITEGFFTEAEENLGGILRETKSTEAHVLYANSLELSAQIEILHKKNWQRALSILAEARNILASGSEGLYGLYIRKWEALAISHRDNSVSPLLRGVRSEALAARHWETVRDCDLSIALMERDQKALLRLYFGTPHEPIRQRISRMVPDLLIPDTYLWSSGDVKNPQQVFDLRIAEAESARLNAGQMQHRMLIMLCRDFYKPVPLLSACSYLFTGEHFNPTHSPNRVHQVVRRLRHWISKNDVPLEVQELRGSYRLRFLKGSFGIRVTREELPMDCEQLEFLQLCLKIKQPVFSNRDVVALLGTSRSSMQRLLKWALTAGKIETVGGGRSTKFKFTA